jgi:hypothetical protein
MRLKRPVLALTVSMLVLSFTLVLTSLAPAAYAALNDGSGSVVVRQQTPSTAPTTGATTTTSTMTTTASPSSSPGSLPTTGPATSPVTTPTSTSTPTLAPSASPSPVGGTGTGAAGGGIVPPASSGSSAQAAPAGAPAQAGGIDPTLATAALGSLGALSIAGGAFLRRRRS